MSSATSIAAAGLPPVDQVDFSKPRYDQGSYLGRLRHFLDVTDPRNCMATRKHIHEAEALVNKVVKREPGWQTVGVEEAWSAKKLVSSAIGPNGVIPCPLRFSAFVPTNVISLFLMVHPSQQTPLRGMFWQWWNQTLNCGVNFANRSNTAEVESSSLLASYCLAIATSCSISFMGNKFMAKKGSSLPSSMRVLVPYCAVATANIANVALVRRHDFQYGLQVCDAETGEELGVSTHAGHSAVTQVAISRVLLPIPLILLPRPSTCMLCEHIPFLKARRAKVENLVNLGVLAVLLAIAAPATLAVFPQESIMPVESLEPEFHQRTNSLGKPVTHVRFDKGL